MGSLPNEEVWLNLIFRCLRRETGNATLEVDRQQNLVESGVLDSMGWVSFLRALESATGLSDVGAVLSDGHSSISSILEAVKQGHAENACVIADSPRVDGASRTPAVLASSGGALGARIVPSEEIDAAFGMPIGKLRNRAGIESVAYAGEGEDELTLGASAAQQALRRNSCGVQELDYVIAAGETFRGYPSLAAQLHCQLLARENCAALDVGGACLGLLHALSIAQALIVSGQAKTILVVTADVHSRVLTPEAEPGEFGGLFGDGASAFLLRSGTGVGADASYRLGRFQFGCAGQYADAVRIADLGAKQLAVHFNGDALSRAAITRLEKVISDVELRSNLPRSRLAGLATHQPNPRLVALLAKQCGIAEEKFPPIACKFGNLGSSTCGLALDYLLRSSGAQSTGRKPIFLASLGPGLLFGGAWLE